MLVVALRGTHAVGEPVHGSSRTYISLRYHFPPLGSFLRGSMGAIALGRQ